MGRRTFTPRDVAPLLRAAERVLEQDPDAALVAAATTPFKRRIPLAPHSERIVVSLPVEVQTSTTPDGVPLHEIAEALRRESPRVTGVSLTPAGLSLKFDRPPTAAQRRKVESLLADPERLEALRAEERVRRAPTGEPAVAGEEELRRLLHDPATADADWLQAFRRYATAHLVAPPAEPSESRGREGER